MGEPMDRDSKLWFGKDRSFEAQFPELNQATIEYFETGDGIYKEEFPKAYTRPHPVKEMLMRCSNPRCRRGGYEVDSEIRAMVNKNQSTLETAIRCPGDEGTPKRDKGVECMNKLHIRLKLTYKPESAKPSTL